MHQLAPLTTSKCKKLSPLWEGGHPPPSPLARSAPSHIIFTAPPKIKSWLRHCLFVGLYPPPPPPHQAAEQSFLGGNYSQAEFNSIQMEVGTHDHPKV